MRCNNCGYLNNRESQKCVKCNTLLVEQISGDEDHYDQYSDKRFDVASTIKGRPSDKTPLDLEKDRFDKSGNSPVSNPPIGLRGNKNNFSATIDPSRGKKTLLPKLQRIDRNGKPEDFFIAAENPHIQLNRGNCDVGNNTITSALQAILYQQDDGVYIEDKSALETTFIVCKKKMKLNNGDVIMLGDRKFIFRDSE